MARKTCEYCGCDLIFMKTERGKWMPCETKMHYYIDDPNGKDTLILGNGQTIRCRIDNDTPDFNGSGFRPHWGNCPIRDKKKATKKETGQLSLFEMAM